MCSMVRPKKNARTRVKRKILNDRRDLNSSDSFDESEVNRNRAQLTKNGDPGLFDLIRRRKSGKIKNNDENITELRSADWDSQPPQIDDREAEPESLPPLEDAPKPIPTFEILKTQDYSFESNNQNESKVDETEKNTSGVTRD